AELRGTASPAPGQSRFSHVPGRCGLRVYRNCVFPRCAQRNLTPRTPPSKTDVRERVWSLLSERGVARFPGARGRIPNFVGAEAAAGRLATRPEWGAARVVKVTPDAPQLPVRTLALREGKRLYMAVPRLAREQCFLELDPRAVRGRERAAASIRGASAVGRP